MNAIAYLSFDTNAYYFYKKQTMKFSAFCFFLFIGFVAAAQNKMAQTWVISKPETTGLSSKKLHVIAAIADSAIRAHAIPGCQVLVARNGKAVYYKTFGFLNYDILNKLEGGKK